MNVYTAGGNALVVGTTATKVTTVADPYQPERLQLALETQGNTIRLDPKAVGGQIGGLLEFRDTVLTRRRPNWASWRWAWPRASTRCTTRAWTCMARWVGTSSTSATRASPPTTATAAPAP